MLLFGDIHCTSAIIDDLIEWMDTHIKNHPEEKSLVFLWDYVYHFSYDRKALIKLFWFFVKRAKEWKDVYVLAWNHDWISNHFVFSEWELLLEAFERGVGWWILKFITSAEILHIEGQDILFFPYTKIGKQEGVDTTVWDFLIASDNANEQRSWYANAFLSSLIEKRKNAHPWKKLVVMHHRYTNKTSFPWQFAQFSYRSPALSEFFMDDWNISLISGHLHQPFAYKNYLCCWSLWSTSPLETNQLKYFFVMHKDLSVTAKEYHHNPYISFDFSWEQLENTAVMNAIQSVRNESQKHLEAGEYTLRFEETSVDLWKTTLYVLNETVTTNDLHAFCNEELLQTVRDIKVKTKRRAMGELLEQLQDASLSLDESISDRKTLLKRFLISRYGEEDALLYEELLQWLKII